ncbi:MAG TPA: tyrosine-type recombinase/integrase [Phycisphaerae bacterium]|nr:tyrosine-type recombinase/integrase [Phycisphaerae bacterium]
MGILGKAKPTKPYPSFPLTAHPNGQWCKKIRGKVHFFGVWADHDTALKRYLALAADLHAGRQPQASRLSPEGLTVKDVCNSYLSWQKGKMEVREIGERWFEDCRSILKGFAGLTGKNRLVADLRPNDFQRYRARQAKRLGVHALTREITVIRSMFKYAYESDVIERPMKFGAGFSAPSASVKRKAKTQAELQHGKRLFRKEELLSILKASGPCLKAAVLLGLNGGFGNLDCATLPLSTIDFDTGVIEYGRPKTGVRRVMPLWPETTEALRKMLTDERPEPADEETAKLALLLPNGRPLVRQIVTRSESGEPKKISRLDLLSRHFAELLKELRVHRSGIGFYALRHTFRTWADEVKDQHAVHRIMGHAIPGMSGIYVEEISLDRLRAVVDHVRSKIFSQ